jgi:hypothetical protein
MLLTSFEYINLATLRFLSSRQLTFKIKTFWVEEKRGLINSFISMELKLKRISNVHRQIMQLRNIVFIIHLRLYWVGFKEK